MTSVRDRIVASNVLCPRCGALPGDDCHPSPHAERANEQYRLVKDMRDARWPVAELLRIECPGCGAPVHFPCEGALQDPGMWCAVRHDASRDEQAARQWGYTPKETGETHE